MATLRNIQNLGRYKNTILNKEFNIKSGRNTQRSTDHIFYLKQGRRIFISDREFYSETYQKV